jgi:hypothetical protein
MKVIEYRLDPYAFFFKCLLEIRVHVAGNRFNSGHPLHANVVNEVIDNLFLLTVLDPEHMAGFKVNDMCRIASAVVKLELIDTEIFRLPLRLYEFTAIVCSVKLLKAFLIDRLNGVLAKTSDLCHLFVCIGSTGKQAACVLIQSIRYQMPGGLEGNMLAFRSPASGATKLVMREQQATQASADAQVPDVNIRMGVDVHSLPA